MVLFLLGLLFLVIGGKLLVIGASQLAATFKVSPLTIGLTVVAFGTSAPEIATCGVAAWRGEGALVMGNIVGSNIFNTLFILGLVAIIKPVHIEKKLIRVDVPIMIAVSLFFWAFAQNGSLSRGEGIFLFAGIMLYTWFAVKTTQTKEKARATLPLYLQIIWIIGGLLFLAFGANWTVIGATSLAESLHLSSLFIGLTFVAIGTSLPELSASITAISRGEPEMAIGNVIGSNLFNLLAVAGFSALLASDGIAIDSKVLSFDLPVMLAAAIATFPLAITGHIIARWEGFVLLGFYALYMVCLLFPSFLPLFTMAFYFFILPLTILVIIITLYRHFKRS
ncbi:MAG: hypothetical protein S4CHLAM45_03980 [Chlamydiales bacterium]|nr:hypothetical protein [Chlamydiales bacterium]MCH9619252.1 hypothetical protein [Chlamydiales bacterium]MCH9622514.1 hypothetical protein [Chlamydiales bacterium]